MSMVYELPTSVEFGGREWAINTDFRDVLNILVAFEDPELTDQEKGYVCLYNLYQDFESIPPELMQQAYDAAVAFIDSGHEEESKKSGPRTMDWEQDAHIIFPAINHVAGFEVRAVDYLHWWTFMGYFMEIKDSTASTVFGLRSKKARGKKLEKWEREYWQQNLDLCRLRTKLTEEEKAEKERLKQMLGG